MKKSISVSNLTLDLYLDYVRPAAIKAGLLEDAVTEEGRPYHITDEAIAKEIEDDMRCACFNAGYDGIERTHEEYTAHEAEKMLDQIDISLKYCNDAKVIEALRALREAMTTTEDESQSGDEIDPAEVDEAVAEAVAKEIAAHRIEAAREALTTRKDRSAWDRGVTAYALELLDTLDEAISGGYDEPDTLAAPKMLDRAMLNGATDWSHYSWGGSALIYDGDIAERLCNPSELKRTRNGERRPNSREEWLDTQARALNQAAARVRKTLRAIIEAEAAA